MPILSIVIPNHNYGRFADRVFGSLAAQSAGLKDVEILFVDDGSTDDSIDRANGWRQRLACTRFEIWPLPRVGRPGPVRNKGFGLAEGRYLMNLDPDDALHPDCLDKCMDLLETKQDVDVVYTDYVEYQPDGQREVRLPDFNPGLLRTQNVMASTAMYRRSLWDGGVRYRDNTDYEDWDFWIQCQMAGARFRRLPEPLCHYYFHSGNFSREARENDGKAKALIVKNNPAFFHPEVRTWADGFLRGRVHSQAFQRGYIPTPTDVRDLLNVVERKVLRVAGF